MKRVVLTVVSMMLVVSSVFAAEVRLFEVDSADAFVGGEVSAVSVDPLGVVTLAPRIERLTGFDVAYVLSATATDDGWVVGTGNTGEVLAVSADGTVSLLHTTEAPAVFAVTALDDGSVLVASSPDGAIERLHNGAVETLFAPGGTYIWDLAADGRGGLWVATGLPGELIHRDAEGRQRVLLSGVDVHARSLAVRDDGSVVVGTAGRGMVFEVSLDGRVRTLFDAREPEIVDLVLDPDGGLWIAAVASEASQVDLGSTTQAGGGPDPDNEVSVSVEGGAVSVGSRPAGFNGPRSTLHYLDPASGITREVWAFDDTTIHSLLWQDDALWVGTGLDGRLYRWQDERMLLDKDLDEKQIAALTPGQGAIDRPAVVTTNVGALYALGPGLEPRGEVVSSVFDTAEISRFGTLSWRGDTVTGTAVRLAVRTGMSAEPDDTWTPWQGFGDAREAALEVVAPARYVQWKLTLEGDGDTSPRVDAVWLSYRQENQRPRIRALGALAPGEVLVPSTFNPSSDVLEPWSETRASMFVSPDDDDSGDNGRLKTVYETGWRTLRWQADDANDDLLVYDVAFRAEGDETWYPMATGLEEDYFSFDAVSLPDGLYRFQVVASDARSRCNVSALDTTRISEPVVIDHTPPERVATAPDRAASALEVEIADQLNPLREAMVSIDGGIWRVVNPLDGMLDERRERFRIEDVTDGQLVLLRVRDAAFNVVTYNLSSQP